LEKLAEVTPTDTPAGEDVRVQLSWLIHDGFIRDAGVEQLRRFPLYLEAARRHLAGTTPPALADAQALEAEFYARTANLSPLERLAPHVQHVRWALEELRLSLLAQDLRTAFPVSVKRVTALIEAL
jgi:ATP-dependent helicase HrpA